MAVNHVIGQVVGGQKRVFENVSTVADVRAQFGIGKNYRASVDGTPQEDSFQLRDGQYVSFSEAVKGA